MAGLFHVLFRVLIHPPVPCPNIPGKCCPAGDDCFAEGCCEHGLVPCGDSETGGCIDPGTEICCGRSGTYHACELVDKCCGDEGCYNPNDPERSVCCEANGGTCEEGNTCCFSQCCYPWAFCGPSQDCEPNPDATCTKTVIVPSTILAAETRRYTVYTTTTEEPPELHPIKCPKTSFVNSLSITVKIDDNCLIIILPPRATTKPVERTAPLERKQASSCYFTETVSFVSRTTSYTTTYETVTSTTTITNPLCYPLTVSNCWGDTLKLNSKCSFEFGACTKSCSSSAADPTVTGAGPVQEGQSQTGSNAASSQTDTASNRCVAYMAIFCLLFVALAII